MIGYDEVRVFRFPNFAVGDTAKLPDGWKAITSDYRDRAEVLYVTARRERHRKRGQMRAMIARKIAS